MDTSEALDASLPETAFDGAFTVTTHEGCHALTTDDIFLRVGIAPDYDDAVPLPGWDLDCTGTTAADCVPGFATDVIDTDDDGNPGATFVISTEPPGLVTGMAHVTLRHTPHPLGTFPNPIVLGGSLEPTLDYDVVSSDATMAGLDIDTPTVKRSLPDFIPLAEGSTFVMVRVDGRDGAPDLSEGGTVTCEAVNSAAGLFD